MEAFESAERIIALDRNNRVFLEKADVQQFVAVLKIVANTSSGGR